MAIQEGLKSKSDDKHADLLQKLEQELINSTLRIHKGGQMPIIPDLTSFLEYCITQLRDKKTLILKPYKPLAMLSESMSSLALQSQSTLNNGSPQNYQDQIIDL